MVVRMMVLECDGSSARKQQTGNLHCSDIQRVAHRNGRKEIVIEEEKEENGKRGRLLGEGEEERLFEEFLRPPCCLVLLVVVARSLTRDSRFLVLFEGTLEGSTALQKMYDLFFSRWTTSAKIE
ncbi:hypothetical protein V1478_000252 [Vespula squamosa]|uniref:Uncharacterized protein n=1 Tax=Vespula squamosa TaxID=30214 RepID=A0ABD2C4Z5_VESSQ